MNRIKLLKSGDAWNVIAYGHLSSCPTLELAVVKALTLAEVHGAEVELGEGVPAEALELGRRRRKHGARVAGSGQA
jgi:hypothetical protein